VSIFWKATVAESHVAINVQERLGPLYETLLVGTGAAVQGSHPHATGVTSGTVVQQGFCGRNNILYKEFNC
jgi:hypothetical protein